MTKTAVADITTGQLIKIDRKVNSDKSISLVPAHTRKAAPARIVKIEKAGRWMFIDTDMGSLMVSVNSKVTIV